MNIKVKASNVIAYPTERLDNTVSAQVEEELLRIINEGNSHLILNMENVKYMSSSGFRACISVLRKLKTINGTFKICCIQPDVSKIFEVIELNSLFDVYTTEEEACKAKPS